MDEMEADDTFEELPVESVSEPGVRIERISPNLERIIVDGLEIFSSNDAALLRKTSNETPTSSEPTSSRKTVIEAHTPGDAIFHRKTSTDAPPTNDSPTQRKISGDSPPKKNPTRNIRTRPISGASTRSSVDLEDGVDVKIELPELSGDEDEELSDGGRTASSLSSSSRRLTRQTSRSQPSPTEPNTRSGKGARSSAAAASKEQAASSSAGSMRLRLRVPSGTPSKEAPTESASHGKRTSSSRAPATDGTTSKDGGRELRSSVSDGGGRELRPRRQTIPKIDEDNELDEDVIDDIIEDEPLFTPSARSKGDSVEQNFQLQLQLFDYLEKYRWKGQILSPPFQILPSKEDYPDYYDEIQKPIAFTIIKKNIKAHCYKSLEELTADFDLMCCNAQQYNLEGSKIFKDSVKLQEALMRKKAELQKQETLPAVTPAACPQAASTSSSSAAPSAPAPAPAPVSRNVSATGSEAESTRQSLASSSVASASVATAPTPAPEQAAASIPMISDAPSTICKPRQASGTIPSSYGFTPKGKRRGRRPLAASRALPELSLANQPPPASLHGSELGVLARLVALYDCIISRTEGDRYLCQLFVTLPSAELYPDYYDIIKEPIALSNIRQKLISLAYANEETFISDVQKMFENARKFNVEGSQVYIDANRLEKTLKKCRRLLPPLDKELTNDPTGASLWERAVTGSLNPFAAGGHEALLRERRIARRALGAGGQAHRMSGADGDSGPELSEDEEMGGPFMPGAGFQALGQQACVGATPFSPLELKLKDLYQTVVNYVFDGRILSGPFMSLPTRLELPIYYERIRRPLELKTIEEKLIQNKYQSLDEMMADFELAFDNACKFNEPNSLIYADALRLFNVCVQRKQQLTPDDAEPTSVETATQPYVPGSHPVIVKVTELIKSLFILLDTCMGTDGRHLSESFDEVPLFEQCFANPGAEGVDPARLALLEKQVAKSSQHHLSSAVASSYRTFWSNPKKMSWDQIRFNVNHNLYYRLDAFQDDLLDAFRYARYISCYWSQLYRDVCELHRFYTRTRDELCRNGELLSSQALRYTENMLNQELREECRLKACVTVAYVKHCREVHSSLPCNCTTSENATIKISEAVKSDVKIEEDEEAHEPETISLAHLRRMHVCVCEMTAEESEQYDAGSSDDEREGESGQQQQQQAVSDSDAEGDSSEEDAGTEDQPSFSGVEDPLRRRRKSRRGSRARNTEKEGPREITILGKTYRLGEFVYIPARIFEKSVGISVRVRKTQYVRYDYSKHIITTDLVVERQIVRLVRFEPIPPLTASQAAGSSQSGNLIPRIFVNWYLTPRETSHLPSRKFATKEVFRSSEYGYIEPEQILGKCYVMFLSDYSSWRPKEFSDEDIYCCDSYYHRLHTLFKKIRVWRTFTRGISRVSASNLTSVTSAVRNVSTFQDCWLLPPSVLEHEHKVDSSLKSISKRFENIVHDDKTNQDIVQIHQFVDENEICYKIGDFVMLSMSEDVDVVMNSQTPDSEKHELVMRIDQMSTSRSNVKENGTIKSSTSVQCMGTVYLRPTQVDHLPTHMFYGRELLLASREREDLIPFSLADVRRKCALLSVADFTTARKTEIPELDVYLCESRYDDLAKTLRKLKTGGIKKVDPAVKVTDDEMFHLSKPVVLRKVPSPYLQSALELLPPPTNSSQQLDGSQAGVPWLSSASSSGAIAAARMSGALSGTIGDGGGVGMGGFSQPYSSATMLDSSLLAAACAEPDEPSETPGIDSAGGPSTPTTLAKRGEKKRTRPVSAYIAFSVFMRKEMQTNKSILADKKFEELSREIGSMWKELDAEKREKYQRMADEMNAASGLSGESSSKRARKSRSGPSGGGGSLMDVVGVEEGDDSHSSMTGIAPPMPPSTSGLATQLTLGPGPGPGPRPPGFPFPQSQMGVGISMPPQLPPGVPQFIAHQQQSAQMMQPFSMQQQPQFSVGAASLQMGQLAGTQQQLPRPPFVQFPSQQQQQQFIPQSQAQLQFPQQQQQPPPNLSQHPPAQFVMQQPQAQFQMQPHGSSQQFIISTQAQQVQAAQPPFLQAQQPKPVAAQFVQQAASITQPAQQFVTQAHPIAQQLVQQPQALQFLPGQLQQPQFVQSQVASAHSQLIQQQQAQLLSQQAPHAPQQQPQFVQSQIPQHPQQIYVIQQPGAAPAPGQPGAAAAGAVRFVQQAVALQQQPGAPAQLMLVQHPTAAAGGSRSIASPIPAGAAGVVQHIRPLQAPPGASSLGYASISAADPNAHNATAQADHFRRLQNQMNNADTYIRYLKNVEKESRYSSDWPVSLLGSSEQNGVNGGAEETAPLSSVLESVNATLQVHSNGHNGNGSGAGATAAGGDAPLSLPSAWLRAVREAEAAAAGPASGTVRTATQESVLGALYNLRDQLTRDVLGLRILNYDQLF